MLRPCRSEWTMHFANGGQEALQILETEEMDVVVSDMRMPSINGATLLNAIRDTYPHIVRIILSGQAEREHVLSLAGATHRYLSKPCDADVLKETVASVCSRRSILIDKNLIAIVSRLKSVPSMPSVYDQVKEAVSTEDSLQSSIGQMIKNDIGLSCKMLQLVNSAFFGTPKRVADPQQAAIILGGDTLRDLAFAEGLVSKFPLDACEEFDLSGISAYSISVAKMAKAIAIADGCSEKEATDSGTAGLLHLVGKFVFASQMPEQYRECLAMISRGIQDIDAIERVIFGATNAQVAAYLLSLWGLPSPIVDAVAWQRCPSRCANPVLNALVYVHVARVYADDKYRVAESSRTGICTESLDALGVNNKLQEWNRVCAEVWGQQS